MNMMDIIEYISYLIAYYTRGFKDVSGGTNGLWGQAALPNQADCAKGTGVGEKNKCGNGALGIDNLSAL